MGAGNQDKPDYFGEALSNFTHDMASGGAIRHMASLGYPVDEIRRRLDFPTPRERVQRTVLEYYLETGVLLEELPVPEERLQTVTLNNPPAAKLVPLVRERIRKNGEEHSYVACLYGMIYRDREARLARMLACLTSREREYVLGIPWKMCRMYHRLSGRMAEIALQMALCSGERQEFYFLKTKEKLCVECGAGPV